MSILAATDSELATADAGTRTGSGGLLSRTTLTVLRRSAVGGWALGVPYTIHRVGITFDRNTLLIYICAGLLAASIGRRGVLSVVRDWLPFGAVLVAYDLSRGAAELLGRPTEWRLQLDFDHWLFHAEPDGLVAGPAEGPFPPWWEPGVSLVYVSSSSPRRWSPGCCGCAIGWPGAGSPPCSWRSRSSG